MTVPIRRQVPEGDFPALIRADMEWKTELGEQQELQAIRNDFVGSGNARWSHMVHEETIRAVAKENQ